MRTYQVISADGHLEIPSEMWTHRVPAKYKDLAPKTVTHEDGSEWLHMAEWVLENRGPLVCDLDYDQFLPSTGRTYHNADGSLRPGCGNASQRLREQDEDGLDAEVLFPPQRVRMLIPRLAGMDREAYLAVIHAYNDWLAEEYCAVAPDRLIGNMMLPETGLDDAIAEIERCRKMGLRTVNLQKWPSGGDTYTPEDDRFFAAAMDIGMALSAHSSWGGPVRGEGTGPGRMSTVSGGTGGGGQVFETIGQSIINSVFDRMPRLQFYMAETQAGHIPHVLNCADEHYQRWGPYWDVKLKKLPSQYIREHVKFSFIHDRLAMKLRYLMGLDLLMWGTDFPHSVGTSPHTRIIREELFEGVPEHERRQVLVDNVCDFFKLDPNKELTPTPA